MNVALYSYFHVLVILDWLVLCLLISADFFQKSQSCNGFSRAKVAQFCAQLHGRSVCAQLHLDYLLSDFIRPSPE